MARLSYVCYLIPSVITGIVVAACSISLAQTEPTPSPQQAQAAAKDAIAKMNQAQESYYTRNQFFANTVSTIQAEGSFQVPRTLYNFAINASPDSVLHYAIPRNLALKAYVGAVFVQPQANQGKPTIVSIVCSATQPGNARPPEPVFKDGKASCGKEPEATNSPQMVLLQRWQ
jgi:hypothetical protein